MLFLFPKKVTLPRQCAVACLSTGDPLPLDPELCQIRFAVSQVHCAWHELAMGAPIWQDCSWMGWKAIWTKEHKFLFLFSFFFNPKETYASQKCTLAIRGPWQSSPAYWPSWPVPSWLPDIINTCCGCLLGAKTACSSRESSPYSFPASVPLQLSHPPKE